MHVLHRQAASGKQVLLPKGLMERSRARHGDRWNLGQSTSVAVGTGASASPCLSPGPCPCLGLGAADPSRLAWLALAPTPPSSSAAPCPAPAPALSHALSACAHALGRVLVPARVLVVCSLALVPAPVPGLKSQI